MDEVAHKTTRILIADDHAMFIDGIKSLLRKFDKAEIVAEAHDGQEALELLKEGGIDMLITDINMPRLDGFGLIERLRAGNRHHDRPILVLTTESSDEKKQRARNAGATGWIVKPFDADKLTAALRRVIH